MQWWCSAQAQAWDWTWRPYVGAWILVALVVAGYGWLRRRHPAGPGRDAGSTRTASFAAAVACLWLALDWPVGALAGYLASAHMVQFLLVGLIAPPLFLHAVPAGAWEAWAADGPGRLARFLTHPLVALVIFNGVVVLTHWPVVVDGLMGSQAGSFVIDMAWIGAGTAFWWPVVAPLPERPGFGYLPKIGYLIAATITTAAPFLFLTFSELPVYATYELAPPIEGISKGADQQAAGLLMKLGGAVVLWVGIAVLFHRWYIEER